MTPQPKPSQCKDCQFWKKDYGTFCFNGWTGMDRDDGHCMVAPVKVYRRGQEIACAQGVLR